MVFKKIVLLSVTECRDFQYLRDSTLKRITDPVVAVTKMGVLTLNCTWPGKYQQVYYLLFDEIV